MLSCIRVVGTTFFWLPSLVLLFFVSSAGNNNNSYFNKNLNFPLWYHFFFRVLHWPFGTPRRGIDSLSPPLSPQPTLHLCYTNSRLDKRAISKMRDDLMDTRTYVYVNALSKICMCACVCVHVCASQKCDHAEIY